MSFGEEVERKEYKPETVIQVLLKYKSISKKSYSNCFPNVMEDISVLLTPNVTQAVAAANHELSDRQQVLFLFF